MRKAKIVCTIGPASQSRDQLRALLAAGMDVARLNFSHGTQTEHARVIRVLRQLSRERRRALAILADLAGAKIRTGQLRAGRPVELRAGARVVLTPEKIGGTAERIQVNYPRLAREVKPGARVLLADGALELRVVERRGRTLVCRVVNGGELGERKGVNLPDTHLRLPVLTQKDRKDLAFALKQGVNYVGVSFVQEARDVKTVKRHIRRLGYDTPVIAKLERPEAIEHLDPILDVADGVMVARGDLGVEMSPEKVPVIQKLIIEKANARKIPVITATQMLESMTKNPRPTRAEASDVANAIFDGSDAVMLSAETAIGRYPRQAVEMMARIIDEAEAAAARIGRPHPEPSATVADTIAESVARVSEVLKLKVIAVFTESGYTARLVSKYRPRPPIVAFSPHGEVRRRLALLWGVLPRRIGALDDVDALSVEAERRLREEKLVKSGDVVGLVAGTPLRVRGTTNLLKLHTIGRTL
ncbi:MAG: pyruvate kinase [Acidobacteria bacterium]|nr:pyruvate kinase [Acidobacteriota bacterium]